jgi:hypothetical protein
MTDRVWPFALGAGGEREILLLRGAEFAVCSFLLGEEDIAAADDDDHEHGDEDVRPIDVKGAVREIPVHQRAFGEDCDAFQQVEPQNRAG